MSSSSINESGREFHSLIVEGRKEFKYVSVLAKGATKRWLCPRVDVKRGANVIETSTRSFYYFVEHKKF